MADNSYNLEIKVAPKAVWFTPTEAKAYYGRYSREGITIHWWGDGSGASNHDNIVNYFLRRTDGSVNYVLSDNKITMMVSPDNVAWTSQSGNATTVSIEHQPTLGAEGYKKSGWLVNQLEQRYGRRLTLYPHKHWYATACPGSIDINRIRAEADKWAAGVYNPKPPVVVPPAPKPTPAPTPVPTVNYTVTNIVDKKVRTTKDANLWDLHFSKYSEAKSVKVIPKGSEVSVSATAKHKLGSTYYISEYSFAKGIGNGINVVDCEDVNVEKPTTPPPPVVIPVPSVPPAAPPTTVDPDRNAIIAFLTTIRDMITAFLGRFKK
jgi:hypothetical protein